MIFKELKEKKKQLLSQYFCKEKKKIVVLNYCFLGEGGQLFKNFHLSRGLGSEHRERRGITVNVAINQNIHYIRILLSFYLCFLRRPTVALKVLCEGKLCRKINRHRRLGGMLGFYLLVKRVSKRIFLKSSLDYLIL